MKWYKFDLICPDGYYPLPSIARRPPCMDLQWRIHCCYIWMHCKLDLTMCILILTYYKFWYDRADLTRNSVKALLTTVFRGLLSFLTLASFHLIFLLRCVRIYHGNVLCNPVQKKLVWLVWWWTFYLTMVLWVLVLLV